MLKDFPLYIIYKHAQFCANDRSKMALCYIEGDHPSQVLRKETYETESKEYDRRGYSRATLSLTPSCSPIQNVRRGPNVTLYLATDQDIHAAMLLPQRPLLRGNAATSRQNLLF